MERLGKTLPGTRGGLTAFLRPLSPPSWVEGYKVDSGARLPRLPTQLRHLLPSGREQTAYSLCALFSTYVQEEVVLVRVGVAIPEEILARSQARSGPSLCSVPQWLTWASWPRRRWAATRSCSVVAWAVPTGTASYSTL